MRVEILLHYLRIVALGIVEGVTEFLPISSTGHLLIAEGLGLGNEPDVFNVVIQAGAILAVVFIYWGKLMSLFGHLENPAGRTYLMKIGLAFVVTSVVIFGIEFLAKNLYPHDDVSWAEAAMMGLAQVLAGVFPGTSRSGATIMTGLIMGMKR